MNCKFAEKVSQLIDSELSFKHREQLRAHIAGCDDCRLMEKDFLSLREQIKDSALLPVQSIDSANVFIERLPFWKRRILLPASAFGFLLLMLGAFVAWIITTNFNQAKSIPSPVDTVSRQTIDQSLPAENPGEVSLSRFDKGRRAEIYMIRRYSALESEKSRSDK